MTSVIPEQASGARPPSIDDVLTVARISESPDAAPEVAVSPDGRYVLYRARETLLEHNQYRVDLWVVPTNGGEPRQLTKHEPTPNPYLALGGCWSPDSQRIAYVTPEGSAHRLRLLGLDGSSEEIVLDQVTVAIGLAGLRWSPDGRQIAFLCGEQNEVNTGELWQLPRPASEDEQMTGIEVDFARGSMLAFQTPPPRHALAVLDLATRRTELLGGATLNVTYFAWSPDGSRFAITGSTEHTGYEAEIKADLGVLDRVTGDLRILVDQPGAEKRPTWSPDGRWIAFVSHRGRESWKVGGVPAIVPAAGGAPRYPTDHWCEEIFDSEAMFWSRDSTQLYFECPYRLGRHLFRVAIDPADADQARPVQVTPEGDVWCSVFSRTTTSSASDLVAFLRESPVGPQAVYISELEDIRPRRLTRLNARFDDIARPLVEHLSWRSQDDRHDIHGLLLLPPGHSRGEPLPLIVEAVGGPTMVPAMFGSYAFPMVALAASGYAILMPNTRGRGGFGETFDRAFELGRSELADPWLDLMAGVDLVAAQGYIDPKRMGLMGHSYGAILTAYGITQTDRFRAAAFHEGAVDMPGVQAMQWDTADNKARLREFSGHGSAFDPAEFDAMRAESPLHLMHQARTPVLIECGELSYAVKEGALLANALNDYGVPFEFVVYPRTGHVTSEPMLLQDDYRRVTEWFDYWLQDVALPDPAKQARYDAWQKDQAT